MNIGIRTIQNTDDEPNKELIITISAPSAGLPEGVIINMEESTRTILIVDDDVPANKIGFDAASSQSEIDENAGGAVFTLEVASALPSETRINIGIDVDGISNPSGYQFSALDPMDAMFDSSNNNLAILAANSSHFTFSLSVPNDTATGDKTLTLTLTEGSLPSGWTLGSANAPASWEVAIKDDD